MVGFTVEIDINDIIATVHCNRHQLHVLLILRSIDSIIDQTVPSHRINLGMGSCIGVHIDVANFACTSSCSENALSLSVDSTEARTVEDRDKVVDSRIEYHLEGSIVSEGIKCIGVSSDFHLFAVNKHRSNTDTIFHSESIGRESIKLIDTVANRSNGAANASYRSGHLIMALAVENLNGVVCIHHEILGSFRPCFILSCGFKSAINIEGVNMIT